MAKLLRAGHKVAICDQVQDPSQAKGLVKREVTRVVTPGTITDPLLLKGKANRYLAAVVWRKDEGAGAYLDVTTGDFFVRRWSDDEAVMQDLNLFDAAEILFEESAIPDKVLQWAKQADISRTPRDFGDWFDSRGARALLEDHFGTGTLRGFGLDDDRLIFDAAAAVLSYAKETQRSDLSHVITISQKVDTQALILDSTTLSNLEIFRNAHDGSEQVTLLGVLDRTVSPPGGRLLKNWLREPSRSAPLLEARYDAVTELVDGSRLRTSVRDRLKEVGDIERLLSRAVFNSLNPRDAAALRDGLLSAPHLLELLADSSVVMLTEISTCDPCTELFLDLQRTLVESPPIARKDGGYISSGVDEELDRLRSLVTEGKQHILALENREKESTGIANLKVRFNRVFGYYIEISRANQDLAPDHYIRKQTLANAERYVTPELKELENELLSAEEKMVKLEAAIFDELRQRIVDARDVLAPLAKSLATLDVLSTFAEIAVRNRYVRPALNSPGSELRILDGRHPVVEQAMGSAFVPNDCELLPDSSEVVLLTGPNMGGKSTFLRQTALLVIMAQIGSFVPAGEASIALVDRVFTRVGASDDLARGESTFMVEMIETANILHQSTPESLVILDEVGRGTATFDGLSLAWAIVEYLHDQTRPKTIFATHYHELTELASLLPRVVNRTMAVKEWENQIVFLHRVIPGSADKSYGLQVARLAGVPEVVIKRAGKVLRNLENQQYDFAGKPKISKGSPAADSSPSQLQLFTPAEEVVAAILRQVDLDRLAPLAALSLLASLKSRLDGSAEEEEGPPLNG
jgi:DNA mismatch repair protein MutS